MRRIIPFRPHRGRRPRGGLHRHVGLRRHDTHRDFAAGQSRAEDGGRQAAHGCVAHDVQLQVPRISQCPSRDDREGSSGEPVGAFIVFLESAGHVVPVRWVDALLAHQLHDLQHRRIYRIQVSWVLPAMCVGGCIAAHVLRDDVVHFGSSPYNDVTSIPAYVVSYIQDTFDTK